MERKSAFYLFLASWKVETFKSKILASWWGRGEDWPEMSESLVQVSVFSEIWFFGLLFSFITAVQIKHCLAVTWVHLYLDSWIALAVWRSEFSVPCRIKSLLEYALDLLFLFCADMEMGNLAHHVMQKNFNLSGVYKRGCFRLNNNKQPCRFRATKWGCPALCSSFVQTQEKYFFHIPNSVRICSKYFSQAWVKIGSLLEHFRNCFYKNTQYLNSATVVYWAKAFRLGCSFPPAWKEKHKSSLCRQELDQFSCHMRGR